MSFDGFAERLDSLKEKHGASYFHGLTTGLSNHSLADSL